MTLGSAPDITQMDFMDVTELHLAVLVCDLDMAKGLIENNLCSPNDVSGTGATPLHFLFGVSVAFEEDMSETPPIENRIKMLELLLEKGGEPNSKDSSERTPLMVSIRLFREENIVLARILLEHGADPLIQDKDGYTSFHHACDFKRSDMMALLIEFGPPVLEFPIGKDRRTLLHLLALCSKDIFKTALETTPVDFINDKCVNVEGKVLDEMLSLPCCLIQNRDLDGLEALLNKKGINNSVLNCPIVSELCRGVYSPVAFSFVKDTYSEFSFRTVELYVDHHLPLDPDYLEETKIFSFGDADVLTCLEILVDVHEFHMGNNLESTCHCARLFILLLKQGARLKPYNPLSQDIVSTRVLKFLCLYGSMFGLVYLLKYSHYLEPYSILKAFITLITKPNTRILVIKHKKQLLNFLVGLCNPEDIIKIREELSHRTHPAIKGILSFLNYGSVGLPSLKCLSRTVARKQCQVDCLNDVKTLSSYFAQLPLPKVLISFLQYDDLTASLKSNPNYPSFSIDILP